MTEKNLNDNYVISFEIGWLIFMSQINNLLKKNERLDDLSVGDKNYKIIQNPKKFCFGMDSVLLCDFVKIKKNDIAIDLGCGNGAISIILVAKKKFKKIIGIEIQKTCVDLAKRNIILNNLGDKIKIIHGDIKKLSRFKFLKNKFDIVVTNPPYEKYLSEKLSLINKNKEKAIARHEILCNLNDIIYNSAHILKSGGKFFMIHKSQRLVDIFCLMRESNLEPKRIKLIHTDIDSASQMILIEGVKNAGVMLKIDEPLIIYEKNKSYTQKINNIYGRNHTIKKCF